MQTETQASLAQVISTLKSIHNVAVDDHFTHGILRNQLRVIEAVGMIGEHVVSFEPKETLPYSVNALYIGDDGMVHISRLSYGVVFNGQYAAIIDNITILSLN